MNNGIRFCSHSKLCDSEFEDNAALLSEDHGTLLVFRNRLIDSVNVLGMHLAPVKCKSHLKDWSGRVHNLVLIREELGDTGKFSYVRS